MKPRYVYPDHEPVTPELREELRPLLPGGQFSELVDGEEVSVYRFPLRGTGGQHGTITVYWEPARFALEMGGPSREAVGIDGDVVEAEGRIRLYPDDEAAPLEGAWWIDPALGAWVAEGGHVSFPLDPASAIAVAKDMGEEWAGGIDPDELEDDEDLSALIANANAPAFPNFPSRELYDVAFDAAIEVLEAAVDRAKGRETK